MEVKKYLMMLMLSFSCVALVACGGGDEPAATAPTTESTPEVAPKQEEVKEEVKEEVSTESEYTSEQIALAQDMADMIDVYNEMIDVINADETLLAIPEFVETVDGVTEAIEEMDSWFEDPANLTPEVMVDIENLIDMSYDFLEQIAAMIDNFAGQEILVVPAMIVNATGADIFGIALSPSNQDNWGGNILDEPLYDGESGYTEINFTAETLVWDLMAGDSEENTISFMELDFSEAPLDGFTIVLIGDDAGNYSVELHEGLLMLE